MAKLDQHLQGFKPLPRIKSYHLKNENKTLDMAARNSISRSVPGGWADPALCRPEPTYFELSMVVPWSIEDGKIGSATKGISIFRYMLWLKCVFLHFSGKLSNYLRQVDAAG